MNILLPILVALAPVEMPEVTVYGQHHVAQVADTVSARRIAQVVPLTTADLLSGEGLLAVQKSQLGGGSPSIRGFEASRVLLSVDGVRMNNLIYRAGHLQNALSVDPATLEGLAVVYGPASVGYGSDALGGVIDFRTKAPKLSHTGGNTTLRFNTNPGITLHSDLNLGGEKFASFTSVTVSSFGDLRCGRRRNPFLPDGEEYIHRPYRIDGTTISRKEIEDHLIDNKINKQFGSRYTQYDIMQRFHYQQTANITHGLNVQFSTTTDVPRYDRLTDLKGNGMPKFAEWYYGPQQRLMAAYTFTMPDFNATLAWQNVKESRHNRKLNDPWLGHRRERVNVLSLTTEWTKKLGAHRLVTGIVGALQWLKSTADRENLCTDEVKPLDTRYPGGSDYQHNIDAYLTHTWRIADRWQLNDGVRIGFNRLHAEFIDKEFYPIFAEEYGTVEQNNLTYSLSAGITYRPADDWRTALTLSTGYRVPNIDDLAKVFDSAPVMVVVPNPHLKPEQTLGLDLNVARLSTGFFQWQMSVFGTYMFHAIALAPSTLGGESVIDYDGEPSEVYSPHNCQRAFAAGASTSVTLRLPANFRVDATATYTYGNYFGKGEKRMPLDHVAPLFGRVGISYEKRKLMAEFFTLFNGKKPLSRYNPNGEDNLVYAPASGMPAWFTLNLRGSWRFSKVITAQLALDNILDTDYRTFASGINAPGRAFTATLRLTY